ncbi:CPBP family intramembrane glutamic endopeptidase [Haloarchaeobius amylolyticus]|uniref:CPBP family intramembrane glutamic endopeptidase n=1 Tax=Haloarchaeobius amylolyticus TaxID=1198296 RepID=UPI002270065B|nr:CPBP family intramembrane glutamic endopeptidase [Haloarchaeobius amylolyticus]
MLREWTRTHQLRAFVLIAFGWTWTWDALYYIFNWGEVLPVTLGRQWGVPIAALVVVWVSDVPVGDWLGRVLDWRLHPTLFGIALFIPLFITNVQSVVGALGGGSLSYSPPGSLPIIVLFVLAQMLLFGGVEEIGWRGFLQPRVQESMSVLTAGLSIGVLWWVWHLPLFIGHEQYRLEPVFFVQYTLFVIGASIVFGAFVNVTDGSVLPLMLMHGTVNLGPVLAGSGGLLDGTGIISIVLGAGLWWLIVLALVLQHGRKMVSKTAVTSG